MSWTDPRTWVTGELVTASHMNVNIRDNSRVLYNSGPRMGNLGAVTAGTFTASGAYAAVSVANMHRLVLPDAKAIYDLGFTPQVRCAGFMKNSLTNLTRFRPSVEEVTVNDAASVSIGTGTEIVAANENGADTYVWKDSGWVDVAVTPGTDPDWIIIPQAGTNLATGSFLNMLMAFRWE